MKKLRKLLILLLIFIIVFTIYLLNSDKKIYYIALGDSLALGITPYNQVGYGYSDYISNYLKENKLLKFYTKSYANDNNRIVDLINDIENNKNIKIDNKEEGIKSILRKSDLITVSIGEKELFYKLGLNNQNTEFYEPIDIYKYIDELLLDTEKLMEQLRKYNKKEIAFIGYYNPITTSENARKLEPIFNYINEKTNKITKKYNIIYIDIYEIFKENPEYIPNILNSHPSSKGYEIIALQIIDVIEKNIIR